MLLVILILVFYLKRGRKLEKREEGERGFKKINKYLFFDQTHPSITTLPLVSIGTTSFIGLEQTTPTKKRSEKYNFVGSNCGRKEREHAKKKEKEKGGRIEGRSQVQRSGEEWEEVPSTDLH